MRTSPEVLAKMLHKLRTAGLIWVSLLALMALAILVGLGTWQWNRKTWKEDLVATIQARLKMPPLDAARFRDLNCATVDQVGLARSCEYTPIRLTGTFDHANERHVYTGIDKPAGGGRSGQGYWIVTPFKVTATGETVAVSRGFIPDTSMDITIREKTWDRGETTFTGLVRSAERRGEFTNANNPKKNNWYLRNTRELFSGDIGAAIARRDLFIDLLTPTPPGGLPQPTAGRVDMPNRHLEYALTWWALAATLLGVFGTFAVGRLRAVKSP
jgi:surfeit locus 1 family protein